MTSSNNIINSDITMFPKVDAFVVKNVLTPEECMEWIQRAEKEDFQYPNGNIMFAGKRKRVTLNSEELAERVWKKIESTLSPRIHDANSTKSFSFSGPATKIRSGVYSPTRVNAFCRFSKYDVGDEFRLHTDTCYACDESDTGLCTVLLYLNGDMRGGETVMVPNYDLNSPEKVTITPEPGLVLVFYHMQPHVGMEVTSGCKYIMRSDVMYRRVK
jgi:hypothetical protein